MLNSSANETDKPFPFAAGKAARNATLSLSGADNHVLRRAEKRPCCSGTRPGSLSCLPEQFVNAKPRRRSTGLAPHQTYSPVSSLP